MQQAVARRRTSVMLCVIFSLLLAVIGATSFVFDHIWGLTPAPQSGDMIFPLATQAQPVQLSLSSEYALLVRLDDGQALLEKGADSRIYPASMTKVMAALVALENLPDLEERVPITEEILAPLKAQSAALAGFRAGERVRAIDLIHGMLLPSGAECSVALALHIAGSEQAFTQLMNDRAASLGLADTHFSNVWGEHDAQHYTTPRDMAALFAAALDHEVFYAAITRARYSAAGTDIVPQGITVRSTLFEALAEEQVTDTAILGGKTGYTKEAGLCLASLAEVEGRQYVLVTAAAPGSGRTRPLHVLDAVAVFEALPQLMQQ